MIKRDIFNDQAKNVVNQAFRLAFELHHNFVGSEHLLWSLSRDNAGVAAEALRAAGLDESILREMIEKYDGVGGAGGSSISITPDTGRLFEESYALARKQGKQLIGVEHLLQTILGDGRCVASRIITSLGVDVDSLANELSKRSGNASGEHSEKPSNSKTKTLDQFSRDLNELARAGKLDPVIGRGEEIQRVVQILSRRTKNNPVLIGEPGVGKTAVAEGLAQRIVAGDIPENIAGRRVVSLDLAKMLSGTKYRGDFEERIKGVLDEIVKAENVILFIDEIHTLIGAGAAEGAMDAANILKPALSRGELQVIGATTLDEYRKHIEKDAALERRFQPVTVGEPSAEDAVAILMGLRGRYEEHHGLSITDAAIEAAVSLSSRYVGDRYLPDKAIDLIDEAASRVRTTGRAAAPDFTETETRLNALNAEKEEAVKYQDFERAALLRDMQKQIREEAEQRRAAWQNSGGGSVEAEDVAAVVSAWTGVPVTMLTEDESARLMRMEETLHRRVVGQDTAVTALSKAIRRGRVGLKDPKRPTGSFLFLGPTGVGKTELCKALAETLFGDETAMLRVDMSEFMERHTVSKLIGSPPGYVGYDEGGQLTEKVRRKPYSVVLFDEIEKAHPDVFNILLQIMEDGILTDSQGRRVDFRNVVLVMTSNIGAKNITDKRRGLGFGGNEQTGETRSVEEIREAVMGEVRATFKPEFLNRIDDILVFSQLGRDEIRQIASGLLSQVSERVAGMGLGFEADDSAVDLLAEKGFDPVYGARPLRRAIQSMVEDAAAEKILEGAAVVGDTLRATAREGKLELEVLHLSGQGALETKTETTAAR